MSNKAKELKFVIIIVVNLFIGILILGCGITPPRTPILKIKNASKQEIFEVKILYVKSKKSITIGTLKPGNIYKHKIIFEYAEDAIRLTYVDPTGNKHNESVVSYLMKGTYNVEVKIKNKRDGTWVIKSKEVGLVPFLLSVFL
jgi:hypothetical protein